MASGSRTGVRQVTGPAVLFVTAGILHFLIPAFFDRIVPPWLPGWLPGPRALVHISGLAELAGGIGLLFPATRRLAAWGLLALLVAVFPANVFMLMDARAHGVSAIYEAGLWIRLPLQPLLMWWVWRSAGRRVRRPGEQQELARGR